MRKQFNSLRVLFGITTVLIAMSFVGGLGHTGTEAAGVKKAETPSTIIDDTTSDAVPPREVEDTVDNTDEDHVPEAINGLLIGFDRTGGLTDVIMVGHIDPANNEVKIISIPRDLEIYFTDEAFKPIKEANPKNRILHAKLNNIYSLIGWDDRALKDVKEIVEVITGLEIDYMMTIDIDGFSEVVDAVGGVEFYVPQDMNYTDPVQDLYIDLDEGLQILDGDKAEQLVRYRKGYERGDLQRIEVQQAFMSAMVDQVIHKSEFTEIQQLLTTGYSMVHADFGLVVMLEYAEFFFKLDLENVLAEEKMITIPSWGEKVEGIWFQFFDLDKAHGAVDALINSAEEKVTEND